MKKLILEIEEMKRRFNFEFDKILIELETVEKRVEHDSSLLESKKQGSYEKIVSVKRLAELYPSFSAGSIRAMIFSNKWDFNGACVVKAGNRKTLIDVEKFEAWIRKPKHAHDAYAHLRR